MKFSIGILLLAASAFLVVSCASGRRHEGGQTNRPTSRTVWYKVQTELSEVVTRPSDIAVSLSKYDKDALPDQLVLWTKKMLAMEGFKVVERPGPKGYQVEISTFVEKPTLVGIGLLNPYYHKIYLRFLKDGKTAWMGRVSGPSEYPDLLLSAPQLLTVLRAQIGQGSSGGEKSIAMKEDDSRVLELIAESATAEGATSTQK